MTKYVAKEFPKEELKECLWGDSEQLATVSSEITDTSRWSIHHYLVFREVATQKLYGVSYSVGATESQDESPFEYEGDNIECTEVEQYEKVVVDYRPVKA